MSWRTVIITGSAKLDYQLDYLVVRKQDTIKKIYIDEISLLLVDSTMIALTSRLMSELLKHKVKVVFCDEKHLPQYELSSYYGSHDTSLKLRQQIGWNDNIKKLVWTEIVKEKIEKQADYLLLLGCEKESKLLREYINEILIGDTTNREGHAAKVYFNVLLGKNITRQDDTVINSALNYGYTMLLSLFAQEIVTNGYITQLGLFHNNIFNQFNLACDLMEPFRIIVDRHIFNMKLDKFEHEEKLQISYMYNTSIKIDGEYQILRNGIKIYLKSIFDALNGNNILLIKKYSV